MVTNTLPATDQNLTETRVKQTEDEVCFTIKTYCTMDWLNVKCLPIPLKHYLAHSRPGALYFKVVGQKKWVEFLLPSKLEISMLYNINLHRFIND